MKCPRNLVRGSWAFLLQLLYEGITAAVCKHAYGRFFPNTHQAIIEVEAHVKRYGRIRQPELSTNGPHGQLLLAIYSYFAQTEREYISMRTKQGLAAARAQGKVLGRPKGSRNKNRVLDPFKADILGYLEQGLNIAAVMKLINPQLEQPVTYNTYRYYVQTEDDLRRAWQAK